MTRSSPFDLAHATLAAWPAVLAMGVLGRAGPVASPVAPVAPEVRPVEVRELRINLAEGVVPAAESAEASPVASPDIAVAADAPPAPAPVTVAPPGATPAFAVAVSGPVVVAQVASAAAATGARVSGVGSGVRDASPAERLVFGEGRGAQPAPEYPREARRRGWEGSVTVRFAVSPAGRVTETRVVGPCAWSALNDAAEGVIRRKWRFPAAASPRLYEITIRFTLTS